MIRFNITGDTGGLEPGVALMAGELGFTIGEDGAVLAVEQSADGFHQPNVLPDFRVSGSIT